MARKRKARELTVTAASQLTPNMRRLHDVTDDAPNTTSGGQDDATESAVLQGGVRCFKIAAVRIQLLETGLAGRGSQDREARGRRFGLILSTISGEPRQRRAEAHAARQLYSSCRTKPVGKHAALVLVDNQRSFDRWRGTLVAVS